MDPKVEQVDDFSSASFPQARPITPCLDGYFMYFRKDGENIMRVNIEDTGAMQMLHGVLHSLAKAQVVPTEMEQICDLLADAIRSSEMGS